MEDFEKKIKESKNCIEESNVNDGSRIYRIAKSNNKNSRKSISWKLVFRYTVMVLLLACVFTVGFVIAKSITSNKVIEKEKIVEVEKEKIVYRDNEGNPIIPIEYEDIESPEAPLSFSSFETKEELIDYLNNNKSSQTNGSNSSSGKLSIENEDSAVVAAEPSIKAEDPSSSYQTNTQVENVDEADIVKVKGNHIFFIPREYAPSPYYKLEGITSHCYMYTEVEGKLELSKTLEFGKESELLDQKDIYYLYQVKETRPMDLYVTDDYLIIRINKVEYKAIVNESLWYSTRTYEYGYACLFQIYDIDTLDLVTTVETAGTNVSTRLIGNELYIINNYNDYLNNTNSRYFYPYFYVGKDIFYPYIHHIYCCEGNEVKTYVSIYRVTLGDEIKVEDIHILTPTVNNIYSTEKNIYAIRTYGTEVVKEDEYQLSYSKSRVIVINIEDGLVLSGCFEVKGSINDKYWIDEKDEYVRVVTTGSETTNYYFDQKYIYKSSSIVFNYLTIFKKTEEGFEQASIITEGLGKPGETVRSARFNGDVVTIVTFKNTDPLYYVDISNPENPVITSSLEITGYSKYQHPYKDNYVIGFGYAGSNNSSGLKFSLFDVSDKNDIKEVGNSYIFNTVIRTDLDNGDYIVLRYSMPDFYSDPKVLFVNNELGIFGFSVYAYSNYYKLTGINESGNKTYGVIYEKREYTAEYYIVTVDLESETPIKVTRIASETLPYYLDDSRVENGYNYYKYYFQRLVFIKDNYYLLSYDRVDSYTRNGDELKKGETLSIK